MIDTVNCLGNMKGTHQGSNIVSSIRFLLHILFAKLYLSASGVFRSLFQQGLAFLYNSTIGVLNCSPPAA